MGRSKSKGLPKVCDVPVGHFSFRDLAWEDASYGNIAFKRAYVPTGRLPDWFRGERFRGMSDFFIRTSAPKKEQGQSIDKENVPDNDQDAFDPGVDKLPDMALMHCERGPKDNRNKQPTAQEKRPGTRVKRSEMGLSAKVGCQVHFKYKVLPSAPHITEIRYYNWEHVNHGPSAEGVGLHKGFSRLSAEVKDNVRVKLLQGLTPAEILEQHVDSYVTSHMLEHNILDRDEGLKSLTALPPPRDFYLSYSDVANIQKEVDGQQWRFADNCQLSLQHFAQMHAPDILRAKFQEPKPGTPDYDYIMQSRGGGSQTGQQGSTASQQRSAGSFYSDLGREPAEDSEVEGAAEPAWRGEGADLDRPETINLDRSGQAPAVESADGRFTFKAENWTHFELSFMKDCNVDDAIRFGHGKPLLMDATFGTNSQKFPLITLLGVDEHNNGVPFAWQVCSQEHTEVIASFLQAVRDRVRQKMPDWEPSCILVDACEAEIAAIRMVFPTPVYPFICHWHAQSAWKRQLFRKCNREGKNSQPNVEPMFRALLEIMRFDPPTDDLATARRLAQEQLDAFLQRFAAEEDFCTYFKAHWGNKLDMICQVFRRLKGCKINCTSHADGYHSSLKANFLHGKRRLSARRLDWLVHILYTRFVEKAQVQRHRKEVGMVRNHAAFYQVNDLILQADKLPGARVVLLGAGAAKVPSQRDPDTVHSVTEANSDGSQPRCTCRTAQKDGMCWHIVKVLKLSGASDKSLLTCLGLFKGSAQGGFAALYAAMAADAAAALVAANEAPGHSVPPSTAAADGTGALLEAAGPVSQPIHSAGVSDADNGSTADGGSADNAAQGAAVTAAAAGSIQRRTKRDKALTAIRTLASLGKDWDPDSTDWERLEHHVRKAVQDVEKGLAGKAILEPTSGMARMLPNPDAPMHNSLQRGKSWLETQANKKKRKHGVMAAQEQPAVFSFLPAVPRNAKPASVLEEVVKKTERSGQHGGARRAAAAAAAAAANHARGTSAAKPPDLGSGASLLGSAAAAQIFPGLCEQPAAQMYSLVGEHGSGQSTQSQRARRVTQGRHPSKYQEYER